jgi:thiol-disulfide isomerase/thioredoxin
VKIQYFAAITVATLLTAGVLAGCTTSTSTTSSTPASQSCAGKEACAGKDACAGKKACAGKDACAGKKACAGKDACAGKKACAGKAATGKLAQSLQGKPVLVDIYASWCPACKNIAPTLSELKKTYADKVNFVVLDVSDKTTLAAAEAKAKELGLTDFLAANKTRTGSVTIVDPATGKALGEYYNNPDKAAYTKTIDAALAKK